MEPKRNAGESTNQSVGTEYHVNWPKSTAIDGVLVRRLIHLMQTE